MTVRPMTRKASPPRFNVKSGAETARAKGRAAAVAKLCSSFVPDDPVNVVNTPCDGEGTFPKENPCQTTE